MPILPTRGRVLPLMLVLWCACGDSPTGRAPDQGDRASDDFCVQSGSAAAQGVLALVNDESIDMEQLDRSVSAGGVGLYRNAATNIVAARPIVDVAQLDAVPYVGPSACRALARHACDVEGRCRAPLSMMSWNIEHFPLTDETEDAVVEIMEELQPDLVGVQEIQNRDAFWELVDELPGYEGVIGERGYFTRVGLLYRTEAVELLETEDLFVDDAYTFPRSVLSATVEVVGALEPTTVTFGVVHLKAFGDAQSVSRRQAAIEDLRGWVDERRAEGQDEVVIVGDWNDRLTDDEEDNVFLSLMEDSADAQFLTLEAAEAGESSYVPFPSLIDHIFATDEVLDGLEYEGTDVLRLDETWSSSYEDVVSDHRPVRARFTVPVRYEP